MHHHGPGTLDIGQVAVPVFVCLLGAVLFMSAQSGEPANQRQAALRTMDRLRAETQHAQQRIKATSSRQDELALHLSLAEARADQARIEQDLQQVRFTVGELTNQVSQTQIHQAHLDEIRRQRETAEAETGETQERLARLSAETSETGSNPYAGLFGAYRGTLVVLDCDREGATVFPNGQRIPLSNAAEGVAALVPAIEQAGFVAVIARPGSFGDAFDQFKKEAFQKVTELNRGRSKPIGRCSFPLDAATDLTGMLPKGGPR